MSTRYEYRIPADPDRLARISLANRARFDGYQARLAIAFRLKVGDWVMFSRDGEHHGGAVEAVLKGRYGDPIFAVEGFAVEHHDLWEPRGLWFALPGDEVEVQDKKNGPWRLATVRYVGGHLQMPDYVVEGSRKKYCAMNVRVPVSAPAAVAS